MRWGGGAGGRGQKGKEVGSGVELLESRIERYGVGYVVEMEVACGVDG